MLHSKSTAHACLASLSKGHEPDLPLARTPIVTRESLMKRARRSHAADDRDRCRSPKMAMRNSPMLLCSLNFQSVRKSSCQRWSGSHDVPTLGHLRSTQSCDDRAASSRSACCKSSSPLDWTASSDEDARAVAPLHGRVLRRMLAPHPRKPTLGEEGRRVREDLGRLAEWQPEHALVELH
eukprot:4623733-Lingulodinium_polyedra.AAC.2